MAHLNEATGLWEDDADGPAPPQAGSLGAQVDTPHAMSTPPMPVPQAAAPAPPLAAPAPAPPPPMPVSPPPPAGPPLPDVIPYVPPPAPIPPQTKLVKPAEVATLGAIDQNAAAQGATAQQAGQLGAAKADAARIAAERDEAARIQHQQQQAKILEDSAKRTAELQAAAKQRWDEYRAMGIKDPEASQSFGHRLLAAIAIGLGEYSSKMNGGANRAFELIKAANDQNIALQKEAITKKLKEAEIAGGDVTAARQQATEALRNLELKHAALLDASASRLKTELSRMGAPEAQIAANQTVQQVEADALQKREAVNQSIRNNETDLAKARIAAAATAAAQPTPAAPAMAQLSAYAQSHPGDTEGLYKLAGALGVPKPDKAVAEVVNQNKPTESQSKDAKQAAVGSRAIDAIEKSGYTPSRAEIQKWLQNQKEVSLAQNAGSGGGLSGFVGGGLASLAQGGGALAQSETEGLPAKAQDYFANVRRFMETIGRAQSGAAISPSEWTNFFNQYGPNSKGGLEAARQYMRDQLNVSGVAGRQIEAGGGLPAAKPAPAGAPDQAAKRAAATRVWSDPSAPPGTRARAKKFLDETAP